MKILWNSDHSLKLSKFITIFLGVALIILDISSYWIVHHFYQLSPKLIGTTQDTYLLLGWMFVCSIPAYIVLISLYQLLTNISNKLIFTTQNTVILKRVSWCCFFVSIVCIISGFVWFSMWIITIAAGFMGLIVRVVKNIFQQAILMKDELELTI